MQVSTGNVACGQPWLRNQAIDSTVRDPGVEVDSALEIAEKFEVWNTRAELSCSACTEKSVPQEDDWPEQSRTCGAAWAQCRMPP